jgi:hypothetical protein
LRLHNQLIDAVNRSLGLTVAAPLELIRTPTGAHLRLAQSVVLRHVVLDEDIEPGDAARTGNVLDYDAAAGEFVDTTDESGFVSQTLDDLVDPHDAGLYLAGERRVGWFDPASGKLLPLGSPGPHLAKVNAAGGIGNGASGSFDIWHVSSGSEADSTLNLTAYNWTRPKLWDDAPCLLAFHAQSRRWYVADAYSATRIRGLIKDSGGMASSDTTVNVDNLIALDGHYPIADASTVVIAANIHAWEADDNAKVILWWNDADEQWEIVNVTCPE